MTKKEFQDLLAVVDKLAHLALDEPSLPSNLDEAAEKYQLEVKKHILDGSPIGTAKEAFKAGAEWMAKQGVSYQTTISADKTIPVLPMKDVSDMGLDYGDKVRVIIVKEK